MADDRQKPPEKAPGRTTIPKPPTREEIEEISRAQQYITDDWTGEGGRPPQREESR